MKGVLLIALCVGLAACHAKQLDELSYSELKAVADQIAQRCLDQGISRSSPEWDACTKQEVAREDAARKRASERRSRRLSTTCTTVGYTTMCN